MEILGTKEASEWGHWCNCHYHFDTPPNGHIQKYENITKDVDSTYIEITKILQWM